MSATANSEKADAATYRHDTAPRRASIVIPVLNQIAYTRGCVETLTADLAAGAEVILIDNGSTDDTPAYLASLKGVTVIRNQTNLGCAAGWNQGVKAATREWIVVLNNDVVVAPGWLEALVEFAESENCGVVTPALREGPLNYPFAEYAHEFVSRMSQVRRMGIANGICFMVHRRVFEKTGLFDENFRIGQFEDVDFFLRAKLAGFKLGTTGRAFLHHFGSITQKAVRGTGAPKARSYADENRAYYRQKWKLTRAKRLLQRTVRQARALIWSTTERLRFGHSLHEKYLRNKVRYF